MSGVSPCTYTYNDADLLYGLLQTVPSWTVRPTEIVIVDDGSRRPLDAARLPGPCRVVRFDAHRGLAAAKHHGPSLATGEHILSVDSDTRIAPGWLKACLQHLEREEVGLVTGPLRQGAGQDIVSRYLQCFGDNHNLGACGVVDFAPGNA